MVRFSGVSGELRVGYQKAARLTSWKLEDKIVEAKLDPQSVSWFWLERRPLDLYLDVGRHKWKWRGVDLVTDQGHAKIILHGEREK